jgi:hypothetical protein
MRAPSFCFSGEQAARRAITAPCSSRTIFGRSIRGNFVSLPRSINRFAHRPLNPLIPFRSASTRKRVPRTRGAPRLASGLCVSKKS